MKQGKNFKKLVDIKDTHISFKFGRLFDYCANYYLSAETELFIATNTG
jgi:hypothetical protein